MSQQPVRVAVTGAAGQISYALLFRIAAGDMLGPDQPVILQLLEIPPAMKALDGVVMELEDAAFPLLSGIVTSDNPETAFGDADFALLVGAKPRGPGMERKDLLAENAKIFSVQGKALNVSARRGVRGRPEADAAGEFADCTVPSSTKWQPSYVGKSLPNHEQAAVSSSLRGEGPAFTLNDAGPSC